MLGRLVSARIKTAEQALQAGRLDEAYRMATAPDLAAEVRIQRLMKKLGDRFFKRAESHYQAGRNAEALQDLTRAARLAGEQPRISDMVSIVQAAAEQEASRRRDHRQRLAEAQERIAAGSLRAAREILARAGEDDAEANRLKNQIVDRAANAAAVFDEVRQHLAGQRWSAAAQRFRVAQALDPKSEEAAECEKALVEALIQQARSSIQAGRVARGLEEIRLLSGIGEHLVLKEEARTIERHMEMAAKALSCSRYEEARRALLPLQQILAKSGWLKTTCNQLKELDELTTQLCAGPMGLVVSGLDPVPAAVGTSELRPVKVDANDAETLGAPAQHGGSGLPDRLVLWVDGAGSYLMLRNHSASIGRAAARRPADIPLISDLSEHHADLRRVEEDYFLTAGREVNVAGRNVRQALLQDGDRIILGRRAKLVFKLPSRKCTSAVLDLVGSARMPNDVRRVILFDRMLSLSRSRQAHIVVPSADEPLVLHERDGRLWIRPQAHETPVAPTEVVLGKPMVIAGVSLVIEAWNRKHDGLHV